MEDIYIRSAIVERIVDGDTLDLMVDLGYGVWTHQRIRLARVNAPEMRGEEKMRGALAKAYVEKLVGLVEGEITVKTTKEKGKYGRYIAEIELEHEGEKINLSDTLLAEGYAKLYEG